MLGTVLLTFGCSDVSQPGNPAAPEPAALSAVALGEREALNELTRAVALALQDGGLRQRVKNDLRDSRHTFEHKLEFTRYLKGENGGILLAKMAKETGKDRDEILGLLKMVRPLEFYMPVTEHRESWRGGADLLVASLLEDEKEAPVGYTLSGVRTALSASAPPATPVLSLVPVETDFSQPLDRRVPNRNDDGGNTIGTLCETCLIEPIDDDGSGSGGGSTSKPGGLYMTYSYVKNDGEAWVKGAPEIEVHVHGRYEGKTYGKDLSCAGDRVKDSHRYFNQDSKTWTGEVLLFTQAEIADYNSRYPEGFNIMMWEDDDTACTIKTDKDITGLLKLTSGVVGATAVFVKGNWLTAAGLFIGTLYESANWLLSNDDFLGDAVEASEGSTRHNLWIGDSYNGYIEVQTKYIK
ncbi:MAG: hypothetical protein H0X65_10245 [Gemmatimonadetes bacterium]|nr:hypothetical protein [Gemmatimonadota bacterium]